MDAEESTHLKMHLSPRELSRAVGASESTLKRWTDDGLLRATRTAGGHRRIAIGEAVRFVRAAGLTVVDAAALGLPELSGAFGGSEESDASSVLFNALTEGDASRCRGLILQSYLAGQAVAQIADQQIAPAMRRIGDLWKHDRKGILLEHRATNLLIEAVAQLRSLLSRPADDAPLAIGAAPTGDPYVLPTLLAATALADEGWRDMNLGPETPLDVLRLAMAASRPKLVWLSITTEPRQNADIAHNINEMLEEQHAWGGRMVVGGQRCPRRIPSAPGLCHATSMCELTAFARGLAATSAKP